MKRFRSAFTLIELMVVLLLVGVVAAVLLPRVIRRSPAIQWKNILDDLNNMVSFARQEAIANHNVYRLTLKSNKQPPDEVIIEEESPDPEKPGRKLYKRAESYYFSTLYKFAPEIRLEGVMLGKQNMLEENKGQGHCYIISDGLVQPIFVRVVCKTKESESKGTYKMNPFMGTFEFSEGFLKPE